ncbi:hypothetical protein UZ39_13415 [Mycobacterium tuberculosis]|uniref:hypothetical protein n=1 Tax=Mycobacterium tuberculosis TaxID=1773 RepID=UPI00078C2209|nr:hypothetical protein [Mycobacterium tuberculosis]AMP28828.1 hypothetical protein UZ39_13415 [Mycobacterium tuberculosis]
MHILYERCAFVDVGQDIIAVAVWVPGEGPDGRKTIKRTLCARRSPTFVDVGQDIIAVAVWVPGEGPDGRKTIKRTLCARRSPICSGRWKGASMITMP